MSATLRTSQHPNSAQAYRRSLALAVLLAVVSLVILPAYAHSGGPSAPSALRTVAGLAAPESLRGSQTAGAPRVSGEILPLERFSPSLLGIYRKVMEIEEEIRQHTDRYEVDYELARAVCMYESGGNANLTSWAGAKGYFQVMSATFRSLRVETNIEAGIKYIGQMVDRFEREDYALAAYNGGPTNVGRGRAMRLESLQYVLGVGHFRALLKLHGPSIRFHASRLRLTTVQDGEDWWALAERLQMPLLQLRLPQSLPGATSATRGAAGGRASGGARRPVRRGRRRVGPTRRASATTTSMLPSRSTPILTRCERRTSSGTCRLCRWACNSGFRCRGRASTLCIGFSRATRLDALRRHRARTPERQQHGSAYRDSGGRAAADPDGR